VLSLKTGLWKTVQQGGYFGRYLPSGQLVYVHQGTLLAVPFDLNGLEVRGGPVPVLEDVAGTPAYGAVFFLLAAVVAILGVASWSVRLPARLPVSEANL
jgi:hypothetical protein